MINIINHTLNMDLANKINMNSPINIKKNDTNSHKFIINLFNNSASHDLTGTTSRIYFKKPDGTKVFLSCVLDGSINNKLSVLLTTQTLTTIGSVACEITIYGTSGEIQTSFTFSFNVLENIRDDVAIESVSEFTALTDALAVVTTIANKADKTYVDTNLDIVNTQLAHIVNNSTEKTTSDSAIVTFIDDDTYSTVISGWKPVLDAENVNITLACLTSTVGNNGKLTLEDLLMLKADGNEIVSHADIHYSPESLTPTEWRAQLKTSRDYLINNNLGDGETIVYPQGLYGTTAQQVQTKALTREFYKYGVDAKGGANDLPVDNFAVKRIQVYFDGTTLDDFKAMVDNAILYKQWLVVLTHSSNAFNGTLATAMIDYVKAQSISILTFGEAEKLVGNRVSLGDSLTEDFEFVSRNGKVKNSFNTASYNAGFYMNTSVDKYPLRQTVKRQILSADDPLFNKGGLLETYHGSTSYSYQFLYQAGTQSIYRRVWDDAGGVWGMFSLVNPASIETGDNTNGSYIKYPDGTLMCNFVGTMAYVASTVLRYQWTYPIQFKTGTVPVVTISTGTPMTITPVTNTLSWQRVDSVNYVSCKADQLTTSTFGSGDTMTVNLVAFGKWK